MFFFVVFILISLIICLSQGRSQTCLCFWQSVIKDWWWHSLELLSHFLRGQQDHPLYSTPPDNEINQGCPKDGTPWKLSCLSPALWVKFHSSHCPRGGLSAGPLPLCALVTVDWPPLTFKSSLRCIFHGGSVISCWCLYHWPANSAYWLLRVCAVQVLKCTSTGTEWPHLQG